FAISVAVAAAVRVVLADADRRDHALALADIDDAHAARRSSRDANSVDRTTDQRAAVGDQHDLVALAHRESRDDLAAVGQAHQLDALAAAAGHAILVGRGPLAEAGRGRGKHELLSGLQLLEALLGQSRLWRRRRRGRGRLLAADLLFRILGLAQRARLAEIGVALLAGDALAGIDQRH